MYDDFDEELDRPPEGSIIKPIFLGCGAMGLGCLFSVAAIGLTLMIFVPGLWSFITNITDEEALMEASLPYVMANEQVLVAVGELVESELIEFDTDEDETVEYEIGDELTFSTRYLVIGTLGTATVDVTGSRNFLQDTDWNLNVISAVLGGGTLVHILPNAVDTPPPPAQLAPPEANEMDDNALDDNALDDNEPQDTSGEIPDDEVQPTDD